MPPEGALFISSGEKIPSRNSPNSSVSIVISEQCYKNEGGLFFEI
jgi:hypothetical protein